MANVRAENLRDVRRVVPLDKPPVSLLTPPENKNKRGAQGGAQKLVRQFVVGG